MNNIARDINVSPATAKGTPRRSARVVHPWPAPRESNLRPRLRAQAKLYFADPICARLAGDRPQDLTALSEQQLGVALLRNFERHEPGDYVEFSRVLHHRTTTNAEIDFVGPGFGDIA